ncbi:unnamed protein product [Linum tenue]|uniref:Transducin/WD40 repeat-like superfamily protein n=1 Tax=Linum tenue TaxID=586396 RepID=A0AAV0MI21_9ROSI|nr:unnamed protein product [Linum tenue]
MSLYTHEIELSGAVVCRIVMAHLHNNDLEYVVDEDYDSDVEEEPQLQKRDEMESLDSDFEDDLEFNKSSTDTTAVEFRNGKDIQGIPWERLNYTRDKYRETRLKQYKNYENLSPSQEQINKLRNLLWATSKHDIYLVGDYSVMHWSVLLRKGKEVLNVAKPVVPTLKRPGLFTQSLSRVKISSMAVKDNILVAGGFQGELIFKYLDHPGAAFCTKLTSNENAITNAMDIYNSPSGSMRIMAANNDAKIRVFDAVSFACTNQFSFDWSVNSTSASPDGKLVAVLGDSVECLLADSQSGKVAATLKGHLDYSFSPAWHPDGRILATGNQDTTCRLWDISNPSTSLAVLKGNMGAIRGLKFTSDGRFLAMQEPADFVHVFDVESGYVKCQEINLFGEIVGISFSPDSEPLFVGVADRTYGSVLEFSRRHYDCCLDSFFY